MTLEEKQPRERRQHKKYGYTPAFGKAYCWIVCPFCGVEVQAFVWSLAGSGKKCTCGALHSSFNQTFAPKTVTNKLTYNELRGV